MTLRPVSTRATLKRGARYILGAVLLALLALIVLATISTTARADTWLTFGFLSLHDSPGYNGANYGLGIEHDLTDRIVLVAGAYENSYHERSRYAGANVVMGRLGPAVLGLTVGGVDGYRDSYEDVPPCAFPPYCDKVRGRDTSVLALLTPTASFNGRRWGVNLALVPPESSQGATAIAMQIKRRM